MDISSLLDVSNKVVGPGGEVAIFSIVDIHLVIVGVGIALDGEVGIVREEVAIPGRSFGVLRAIFVSLLPVFLLHHSLVSD